MDSQFDRFMLFCEGYLDSSSRKLLDLAKKRYQECDEEYKESQEFLEFILCAEAKIEFDETRFFVHLRDFLNILKDNKARSDNHTENHGTEAGGSKRLYESSESESDYANTAKRRKVAKIEKEIGESDRESDEGSSGEQLRRREDKSSQHDVLEKRGRHLDGEESSDDNGSDKQMEDASHTTKDVVDEVQFPELQNDEQSVEREQFEGIKKPDYVKKKKFKEMPLRNDNKEKDSMFSSSEDEITDTDSKIVADINNIIQDEDQENLINFSPEQSTVCRYDDVEDKHTDFDDAKAKTNTQNVKKEHENLNEDDTEAIAEVSHEILNISSETEEKVERNEQESEQKDGLSTEGTSQNCSEIESCVDQDSVKDKWDNSEVLVIENDEKPLCLTLKRVIGTEAECDSPNVKHSSSKEKPERLKRIKHKSSEEDIFDDTDESDSKCETHKVSSKNFRKFDNRSESEDNVNDGEDNAKLVSRSDEYEQISDSFSDDGDPFDAVKEKKVRERCKKKYVVSVGKKKEKAFNSFSKDHFKLSAEYKHEKEKSPRGKRTPNNSPKCKKKISPNKSPIIIFTDSESDSDIGIEGFKKKFDEKVRKRIQLQDDSSISAKKTKTEPIDSDEDVHGQNENRHSARDSHGDNDSDNEKPVKVKESKEKKRVSLITEEYYSKQQKEKKSDRHAETEIKDKHKYKSEEKSPKPSAFKEEDDEKPGPSSVSDSENVKKKGSTRQIRKLEALLEGLRNQIEKVRCRELDLEDMDNEASDYILEDKLQKKFMKVWDKLCELHKAVRSTGRPTDKYFRYQGTRYPDINRKIEKFINKKKVFPDYHDVRSIILKVNKDKKLHLRSREIDDLSREAFTDVGNQLQRRRQKDLVATFHYPGVDVNPLSIYDDPALLDSELKRKLESNKKSAKSNMEKVVEKYAALQYQDGDKTDNEGDEEEEEEEDENDNNMVIEELDKLTKGDNSDSDNNTAADDEPFVSNTCSDRQWETEPCLEIVTRHNIHHKNLENGKKSMFLSDRPEHVEKLSPMKSRVKQETVSGDPQDKHFSEALGLCRTSPKDSGKQADVTVTILSDNDDDNEVKCSSNAERDLLNNTSSVADDQKESLAVVDVGSKEESGITGKIDETVKTETDAKNTSDLSNITIITDDEEEEEVNESDQSLGLKIVSAHHVSLSDISKLHGEEEIEKSVNVSGNDDKESVNDSGESVTGPIKFHLETEEETANETDVPKQKEKFIENIESFGDRNNQKNSDPEIMIIDDVETESLGEANKPLIKQESSMMEPLKNQITERSKENLNSLSVLGKESELKRKTKLPDVKRKHTEVTKSFCDFNNKISEKIIEVLNSEPEIMIIEDTETSEVPVMVDAWKDQPQERSNVKTYHLDTKQRYRAGTNQPGKLVTVSNPLYTDFSTTSVSGIGLDVRPQKLRKPVTSTSSNFPHQNPSNLNNRQKIMSGYSKVTSPVKLNPLNPNSTSPVSNAGWNVQSQKGTLLGTRDNIRYQSIQRPLSNNRCFPTTTQRFPSNSYNNINNMNGKAKGNAPIKTSSKSMSPAVWSNLYTSQKFGRSSNLSSSSQNYISPSKQYNTFSNRNSFSTFPTKSNPNFKQLNTNKGCTVQSNLNDRYAERNCNPSQGARRFPSNSNNLKGNIQCSSKLVSSKANFNPSKTRTNTMFTSPNRALNVQRQSSDNLAKRGGNSVRNSQNLKSSKNLKASPLSSANSETVNEVVVIDCDEPELTTTGTKPCAKRKTKSSKPIETACEVICIDIASEAVNTDESAEDAIKDSRLSSDTVAKLEKAETGVKADKENSVQSHTASPSNNTKEVARDSDSNGSEIPKSCISLESNILVDNSDSGVVTLVEACSNDVKDTDANNSSSNQLKTKESVVEKDQVVVSKDKVSEEAGAGGNDVRPNMAEVEEEEKSPSDIFAGSLGTIESNEYASIESCHDSEIFDNLEDPDEGQDEELDKDQQKEYSPEVFTAVKLKTVTDENKEESSLDQTVKDDFPKAGLEPEVARKDRELLNQVKSINENTLLDEIKRENEEDMVGDEDNSSENELDTTLTADVHPTCHGEEEVSGSFEDEDNISSTSCDNETVPKVKMCPDIRNKLLQLNKAIVSSKPHKPEMKSQVKTQDRTPKPSVASRSAQWIEEDENASLIETYQEPDTTPNYLAENLISSSSNENIIVLSDSE